MKFLLACMTLWIFPANAAYYSQYNQDQWINENIFKNKTGGVFIDVGAHDGKTINNTYFFENELGWSGICVEPIPDVFQKLRSNRNCICIEGGIAEKDGEDDFLKIHGSGEMLSGFVDKYDPRHVGRIHEEIRLYGGHCEVLRIKTFNLNTLFQQNNLDFIDFLSLDTEGGELDILKSIDFERYHIKVISVENNFQEEEFSVFLGSKGYRKVIGLGCDEVYVFQGYSIDL